MKEYIAMWKNYVNFSARTSRRGYWMAALVNFIISFVIGVVIGLVPEMAIINTVYSLAILIPSLGISVRRLRDAGKHWAWLFINLIPIVGQIVFIVMLCKQSIPENGIPQV